MKTFSFQKSFWAVAIIGLALVPLTVAAQDAAVGAAPPLAYGVPQILQLAQAKVGDDVIIAYVHQTGNSYGLDAEQILYLRQQGISDKVLIAMLTRPKPASTPAPALPATVNPAPVQTQAAYAQPAPDYVQSAPSSSVYVMPNNQIYYSSWYPAYYPYYSYYGGYYPYLTFSYPWGRGYYGSRYCRGGYGYRGGYYGGGYYNGYRVGNYGYVGRGGYHGGAVYAGRGAGFHGGAVFAGGGASYHGGGFARAGGSFQGGGGFGGGFHGGGMMRH